MFKPVVTMLLVLLATAALAETPDERMADLAARLERIETMLKAAPPAPPAPATPPVGRWMVVTRPADPGSNFTECAIVVMDTVTGGATCFNKLGKPLGSLR